MFYTLLDVVRLAEDHPGPREAGTADLFQLDLAEGALETGRVPVAIEGVQQEPVKNVPVASGALLDPDGTAHARPRRGAETQRRRRRRG